MTTTIADAAEPTTLPGVAKRFRVVAVAEAISWLGLLIGMAFKYGPADNPIGDKIFGPIHGAIFVLYLIATLLCIRPLKWGIGTTLLALAAAIPPFFTLIFEVWAQRTGRLRAPAKI